MNRDVRRRPRWRVDVRVLRPELVCVALALTTMLLTEVWQSSRMAQQSMALDTARHALQRAHARLAWVQAQREHQSTRTELTPFVSELGLVPADAQQVVHLPSAYLAAGTPARSSEGAPSVLALAERASRMLVPDASARARDTEH